MLLRLKTKLYEKRITSWKGLQESWRHLEVQSIVTNVLTILEITKDVSTLVQEQGEDLNHIEHNVESSKEYVEEGKKRIAMVS